MRKDGPITIHGYSTRRSYNAGVLSYGNIFIPCIFGSGGVKPSKREGDGVTPTGCFEILYGFYRSDRIGQISTKLNLFAIKKTHGWCDDPDSPMYNRFVRLPTKWSHETLHREDHLYDICLVLNHNIYPRKRNGGSAIFFHLTGENSKPTRGCVAISCAHMKKLLTMCSPESQLHIHR